MSTKTSIKRIAAVAAVALTLGGFSAVSAFADATAEYVNTSTTVATSPVVIGTNATQGLGNAAAIAGLTAAPGQAIVFKVTATGVNPTFGTSDVHYLYVNSQLISTTVGSANATNSLASYNAPAAGTYTVLIRTYVGGVSVPANVFDNALTLTVSGSALTQYGISTSTANSTSATLAGVFVSSVGVAKVSVSGRVGVPVGFTPNFKLATYPAATGAGAGTSANANTGVATMRYSVTGPTGAAVTTYTSASATTADGGKQYVSGSGTRAYTADGGAVTTDTTATSGSQSYFVPSAAGSYTITAYHDANGNALQDAGEAIYQTSLSIAADSTPTITFTQYGSTGQVMANGLFGKLVKISLLNGTLPATLASNETLTLTGATGVFFDAVSSVDAAGVQTMVDGSNATSQTLTTSAFNASGVAYVNVGSITAGTNTISATVTGGTAAGASGSFSFTAIKDVTATVDYTTTNYPVGATNATDTLGSSTTSANVWAVQRGIGGTVTAKVTTGNHNSYNYYLDVVDTAGLITGLKGATYQNVVTTSATATLTAASTSSFSLAIPGTTAVASGTTVAHIITLQSNNTTIVQNISITEDTAAPTTAFSDAANSTSSLSVRAAVASTGSYTVTSTDQFGNALPNITYTGAVVGRNSATVLANKVTDANGQFTWSLADTYTGTALLSDTVTWSPTTGVGNAVYSINYAAYNPVTKITVTTDDSATATATGIAGTVKSVIDAGSAGASNTTSTISAVLTDVNGGTLPAGIPVTFSVDKTGAAITSTTVNGVTNSNGKVTASIYGWLAGTYTVTVKAGAVSGTGSYYFADANTAFARTVSAVASGNVVTATVKDRYGNPIAAVTLTASRVGTGTFNGTSSTTGVTDKNGSVDFVLTNGSAVVTVAFSSATFGQSAATAGYVDAGVTAITASTAGTPTTAEAGVGASFAPAGVNSASVSVADTAAVDAAQAAQDAANEATDAANAATDAANNAMDSADAAQQAAMDAGDKADAALAAVTDLATKVSEIASQISSLSAVVAKIAAAVAKISAKVKA